METPQMIKFLISLSFYDNRFMIIGIKVVSLQKKQQTLNI